MTLLRIDQIDHTAIQARAEVNHFAVREYADARKFDEATFPPVVVFHVGKKLHLVDGRHRIEAAIGNGETTIECVIHEGSMSDARAYAAGANADHGLRRTNADKAAAVKLLLNDEEWRAKSDREIASQAKVTHPMVSRLRTQLVSVTSSPTTEPVKRIGKDKKARKVKAKAKTAAPRSATSSTPEVEINNPLPAVADAVVNGRLPLDEAMKSIGEEPVATVPEAREAVEDDVQDDREPGVDSALADEIVSRVARVRLALKDVADEHLAAVLAAVRAELDRIEERAAQEAAA